MPTHDETKTFLRDYRRLTSAQRTRFHKALAYFIADLQAMETGGRSWFRPSLRVKSVRGIPGLYEMSWAPDGRATFSWGDPGPDGQLHVQWHRCGTHSILP